MKRGAPRTLLGTAVILAGLIALEMTSTKAADGGNPVPESEFKGLVDRDVKNIEAQIEAGKKGNQEAKKKAALAVKSSAMMIAAYAQSRIGTKGADDAKLASLRDQAIKVGAAAGKKNFAGAQGAEGLVKLLKENAVDPMAKKNKVDLIKAVGGFDIDELMYQLKKTGVGGLGIWDDIKEQADEKSKKPIMAPAKATELAQRLLILADYCDVVEINGGFVPATLKKTWEGYNKDMRSALQGVIAAAPGKAADLRKAFLKLDASCAACHNTFKKP